MDFGFNDYVSRADVLEITAETGALETQRRVKELNASDVRTVAQWIKTTARLPDEYGEYLAVVGGEVRECCYATGQGMIEGWSTCNADGFTFLDSADVTHWMPLPEPPENETEIS